MRGSRLAGKNSAMTKAKTPRLSETTPASFIAFDLLALGDEDYTGRPFAERRAALERALADARAPIHLTPTTADLDEAQEALVSPLPA